MASTTDKLAALLQKQSRIKARIEQLQTQQQKQARKDDTRLKIIVGATVMSDAAIHPQTMEFVRAILARAIKLDRDKQFLKEMGWL